MNEQLKAGDELQIMAPEGRFIAETSEGNSKRYVCFAGGSGITPIISILKAVLQKEAGSKVSLFYSNSNAESVIFKAELESLVAKYGDRLAVHYIYSRPKGSGGGWKKLFGKKDKDPKDLFTGRVDVLKCHALIEQHLPEDNLPREYYICGPEGMMNSVSEALTVLKVDAETYSPRILYLGR